jgi:uncharacterized protein (DUF433 family)
MTWTDHVGADAAIAAGKPVIKGTRLAVDFGLGLLADAAAKVIEEYQKAKKEKEEEG